MVHDYRFAVIQLPSHPTRGEVLNVGLAVSRDAGIEFFCPRLDKIRALTAAIAPDEIRNDVLSLSKEAQAVAHRGLSFDQALAEVLILSSYRTHTFGSFRASSQAEFESQIDTLLKSLIVPEPAPFKAVARKNTKLKSSIKKALAAEKISASKDDNIDDHRVVSNHIIDEGVIVDFLLKNSAYYVIETVDLSNDDISIRKAIVDIAISALTFEHARIKFEGSKVNPRLVYDASYKMEKDISSSLNAAANQGAELLNWASAEDKRSFVVEMASHAVPRLSKRELEASYHASTQHRFKIN